MKTRILFFSAVASLTLSIPAFATEAAEAEAACYRAMQKDTELAMKSGAPRDLSLICKSTSETTSHWRCVEKYVDKGNPANIGKARCEKK